MVEDTGGIPADAILKGQRETEVGMFAVLVFGAMVEGLIMPRSTVILCQCS